MRAAGAYGDHVKVWGPGQQPYTNVLTYLASVLNSIGLKASIASIQPATYWNVIGSEATHAQIGLSGWLADYPNPIDWFDTLLNGERITATHNNNYGNANDPRINHLIDQLRQAPRVTGAVNAARVERMVLTNAFIAPLVYVLATNIFALRVDMRCYVDQSLYGFAWTQACVK